MMSPLCSFVFLFGLGLSASETSSEVGTKLSGIDIECNSNNILVTIETKDDFNGMIYPKGLSKNSSCLAEYDHAGSKITYALPLRSCNTMSHDIAEGVEYFNTVVVQPHHKLVTSFGKGFHVRCRYKTENKTAFSNFGVNAIGTTPVITAAPMPVCTMKIYVGNTETNHIIAEHVKIGDYLTLVISIEEQAIYGMKVTNCIVKDGLNWSEQPLITSEGCPIDEEVMGPFEYNKKLTSATVTFPAHKFPFTTSVYYQCNVKLCLKEAGGCDDVPPVCDASGYNLHRRKRRDSNEVKDSASLSELRRGEDVKDHSVEVYSGLYVNEVDDIEDEKSADNTASLTSESNNDFCVSTRKFAIGIAIAGVLLMLAVIFLVACIVHRRRRKATSTSGSSIYSGPYSNHAYSRD